MSLIVILLVSILILWIICRGNIYLHIYYFKNSGQDCFKIVVYLFKYFKVYQQVSQNFLVELIDKKIDKIFINKEIIEPIKSRSSGIAFINFNEQTYEDLFSLPWVCRKMSLNIKIASEDAAETAIFYGIIHIVKSLIFRWLLNKMEFKTKPEFLIMPDFNGKEKEFSFKCIISTKIGNFIYILKNSV